MDISDKTNELEKNTAKVIDVQKESLLSLDNLDKNNNEINEIIGTARAQVVNTLEAIDKVNSLMERIKDIASQTNLLSLNASIEAAHAGEFGRGFAVVASEIGHLADESQKLTSDVTKIMSELNSKSEELSNSFNTIEENSKTQSETMKVTSEKFDNLKTNTAIAAMMSLVNEIFNVGKITMDEFKTLIKLLCPFAPHLAEEMWETLGGKGFCSLAPWPEWDEAKTVDSTVEAAVQVNGKVRATVAIPVNCPKEEAIALAKADPKIAAQLEGKTVVKEISVPNKIVNLVVK